MGRRGGRKGKGGRGGQQLSAVTESTRVQISKVLEDFRSSNLQVYTFEPGLSRQDRASIHQMCRKMGLQSKSSGLGVQRKLSIYRNERKMASTKKKEAITCLTFSKETKNVIRDLFTRYPPDDGDISEDTLRSHNKKKSSKAQWRQDSSFCKPSLPKDEIAKKVKLFASGQNEAGNLRKIMNDRAKLPIVSFKDAITSSLETNQTLLISGETGCGKTTQVPQYILDHIWSKGESCKIVCTQPRRISAISVAERISYERGETVGNTVGYKIRLEAQGGKQSSIMFCTNGVLLRLLIGRATTEKAADRSLKDSILEITHIIVDEIHERDRFSDFMLTILRDLLPAYPHLRLILMSATLDAEKFSAYFGGCPIIKVPGFTYPVKTFYLEDVLTILKSADGHLDETAVMEVDNQVTEEYKSALDESINLALSSDEFDPLLELISCEQTPKIYNYQHSSTGISPLMVFAGKGRVSEVCIFLSLGADCSLRANDGTTALDCAQRENQLQVYEILKKHVQNGLFKPSEHELLEKYLASVNPELIDTVLIERLLRKICTDSNDGAILVFLPGWDDINQTKESLLVSPFFRDPSKFLILSLHSMMPSSEQKKVFKRPPVGVRKIILSTNVAETAVTIEDIVYVVDSGRMKEKSYDPYKNVSTLHSSWVSKANARQREGRSGRCQPGTCYHLFSKIRAASLPDFQDPEIKRMPIEELCLQVKLLDPHCKISEFFRKTLDPPVPETVHNAILLLQDIGALTQEEVLTELGEKLGSLPVHPSTSKMLLFAVLMSCLEPALTIACAADYREPFLLPMAPGEKKKAAAAKVELASLYGGYSDQLAVVAAFECWRSAKNRGQESQFCSRYFISSNTMNMLFSMRKQLQNELAKNGFIPDDLAGSSVNARDPGILRAVLMAGSYPMVGRLLPRRSNSKERTVVETASVAKVRLHHQSSNFSLSFAKSVGSPLIIYDEITRGDGGMYIKNCSLVGSYPLLLLAMEMIVAPPDDNDDDSDEDVEASSGEDDMMELDTISAQRGKQIMSSPDNKVVVVVDRWLRYESTALDVAHIYCLRERLSASILFKVKNPKAGLPPALDASMHAIASILSFDGLCGLPPAKESMEPQMAVETANVNTFAQNRSPIPRITNNGFLNLLMSDNNQAPTYFNQQHRPYPIQNPVASTGVPHRSAPPNGRHINQQHRPYPIQNSVASTSVPHRSAPPNSLHINQQHRPYPIQNSVASTSVPHRSAPPNGQFRYPAPPSGGPGSVISAPRKNKSMKRRRGGGGQ